MNILLIEDNPDHVILVEDLLLQSEFMSSKLYIANTLSDGVELLTNEEIDVCLCDLSLPDSNMEDSVNWLADNSLELPFVTLTSLNDEATAKQLLKSGVQDYIPKEELNPFTFSRAINFSIERFKHHKEILRHNSDMQAFCSSLSHDFNAHISRIIGVSQALKRSIEKQMPLQESDEKWFAFLDTSTSDVHQLVTKLQHYLSVKYISHDKEIIKIDDVVVNATQAVKQVNEQDISIHYTSKPYLLRGNLSMLQLMLQNLIVNGIKYNKSAPRISIDVQRKDKHIKLSVTDNGIGFDVSQKHKMFTPFKRLDNSQPYAGTGMGLSIVKSTVEHHNGKIHVESSLGKGSTFTISLPIYEPTEE